MKYRMGESDNLKSVAFTDGELISLLCGDFVDPDNCGLSDHFIALIKQVERDRKVARRKIRVALGQEKEWKSG